ncbi:hypothetical protein PCASD_25495 [Puccinia coronata f. sp. avenae]|uniref:Uncharacterized protein n=1 Tax=Puccinia coronata f. sp. avenae TaxID=200324 RepID=A0A2N5SF93_9BASI|nr:hypothetical protein PCASD_25495 [Puccinia coronata f. sp. avenae]
MGNQPSAAPMACMEQGNGNTLNHSPDPSEIKGKERASAGGGSNLNMSSSASKDKALPASLELLGQETQERPSQSQTNCETQQLSAHGGKSLSAQKRKTYAEQIASEFLPLKKDMAADRAASNDIAKRMAESNARMVQAAQDVAKAISSYLSPTYSAFITCLNLLSFGAAIPVSQARQPYQPLYAIGVASPGPFTP